MKGGLSAVALNGPFTRPGQLRDGHHVGRVQAQHVPVTEKERIQGDRPVNAVGYLVHGVFGIELCQQPAGIVPPGRVVDQERHLLVAGSDDLALAFLRSRGDQTGKRQPAGRRRQSEFRQVGARFVDKPFDPRGRPLVQQVLDAFRVGRPLFWLGNQPPAVVLFLQHDHALARLETDEGNVVRRKRKEPPVPQVLHLQAQAGNRIRPHRVDKILLVQPGIHLLLIVFDGLAQQKGLGLLLLVAGHDDLQAGVVEPVGRRRGAGVGYELLDTHAKGLVQKVPDQRAVGARQQGLLDHPIPVVPA